MRIIGLTGGIGTGKSTVARILSEFGLPVVDADKIAREVVEPGTACHAEIVAAFGKSFLTADGRIDRKKLGTLVFSDPVRRAELEAITHPRIQEGIEAALAALEAERYATAIVEIPLLHENRRGFLFEAVICVYCDRETQLRRILARDDITAEEACRRIDAQMDTAEKARRSDHVIDNSGTEAETLEQIGAVLSELKLTP